ncbi:MAG: Hydrogenase isoenzyme nickel incorporation protein HypB [Bacteroidota bacterium]
MCGTCGCGTGSTTTFLDANHHSHAHEHDHPHDHVHSHGKTVVEVEQDVLLQNNLLAQRNRGYFDAKNILALNLVSSPGSGKTSLLERTLIDQKGQLPFAVIEGDQQTTNDADRIHATGTKVTQINTGKGCHLDAHMVMHAVQGMKPADNSVLFIENVGNLVCPAMFDLGEKERVVVISVTEGDDKPLKYPDMFYTSTLCIINKIDLLPYVPFSMEKVRANAKKVNPNIEILELSCTSGKGLNTWYQWLQQKVATVSV